MDPVAHDCDGERVQNPPMPPLIALQATAQDAPLAGEHNAADQQQQDDEEEEQLVPPENFTLVAKGAFFSKQFSYKNQ